MLIASIKKMLFFGRTQRQLVLVLELTARNQLLDLGQVTQPPRAPVRRRGSVHGVPRPLLAMPGCLDSVRLLRPEALKFIVFPGASSCSVKQLVPEADGAGKGPGL